MGIFLCSVTRKLQRNQSIFRIKNRYMFQILCPELFSYLEKKHRKEAVSFLSELNVEIEEGLGTRLANPNRKFEKEISIRLKNANYLTISGVW